MRNLFKLLIGHFLNSKPVNKIIFTFDRHSGSTAINQSRTKCKSILWYRAFPLEVLMYLLNEKRSNGFSYFATLFRAQSFAFYIEMKLYHFHLLLSSFTKFAEKIHRTSFINLIGKWYRQFFESVLVPIKMKWRKRRKK